MLLATLAALTYGVADYCGGRATRSAPAVTVVLWAEVAGVVIVVALLPVLGDPFPGGRDVWFGLLTAGVGGGRVGGVLRGLGEPVR